MAQWGEPQTVGLDAVLWRRPSWGVLGHGAAEKEAPQGDAGTVDRQRREDQIFAMKLPL
jgi:hypothetical protein